MAGDYSYTPHIWPMLASATFAISLAVYAWRHRHVPAATAFAVQELAVGLWGVFAALQIAVIALPTQIIYYKLEVAATLLAASATLCFALEYAGAGERTMRRTGLALSLVILGFIVLIATNDLHHLMWTRMWYDRFMRFGRGPLNLPFLGWGTLMPVLALSTFLRQILRSRGIYRWQALLLFGGTALPVLAAMSERFGFNPIAPIDPAILVWNLSSLLFVLAIFRFGMLAIVPVGRHTAIERMPGGMLILDAQGQIVDLNPAAVGLLALARRAAIGRSAQEVLGAYGDLPGILHQGAAGRVEVAVQREGRASYLQAQVLPLAHPDGFPLGQLILLQDVTGQHQAQAQILQQQRTLAALRERERLARELHDGLGQSVAAAYLQATTAKLMLARGETAKVNELLDFLSETALQVQADVREYLLGARMVIAAEDPFLPTLRDYIRRFTRQFGLPIELAAPPELEEDGLAPVVALQLFRIIQEALSNARKHACAGHATVTIAVDGSQLHVAIADDGCGFDPAAIAARSDGYGLRAMQGRAEEIGGSLAVTSVPGQGTQVEVWAPLEGSGGGR